MYKKMSMIHKQLLRTEKAGKLLTSAMFQGTRVLDKHGHAKKKSGKAGSWSTMYSFHYQVGISSFHC
jgi:hypothetical protein